jgi:chemotaxis protein methyltransferase CheR
MQAAALSDTPKMSQAQFTRVCEMLYRLSGIVMRPGKEDLANSRLARRLRATQTQSFDEYLSIVERNKDELALMVDVLTTNKTNFMREAAHFDLIADDRAHNWAELDAVRIWSAACSTGEEPYTIAMTLLDRQPAIAKRTRILATDLASHVLEKGRKAEYRPEALTGVPKEWLPKYFEPCGNGGYRVNATVRRMVSFARLNLLDPWPMGGPFQAIFCRNVMIYFDKQTQLMLARRFRELLATDGYLLIGHAESFGTSGHQLRYVKPAVYAR